MMKLSQLIDEENIIPDLKAVNKRGVLEELADAIIRRQPKIDRSALVNVLVERERLGSTGIGDGVAIPHGKLNDIGQPIISFGRSKSGLDFDSMDGQLTYLFFLLLAPENSSGVHLQVLAKIAKILKNSAVRKNLKEAETKKDLLDEIIRADEET